MAISGMIMPLIVESSGWRMGWKGLGGLAVFVSGMNFLLVKDYPASKSDMQNLWFSGSQNKVVDAKSLSILRNRIFWLIGLSYLLIAFSVLIPLTFTITFAVQELMLPYHVAARLITVMAASSIIGKLILGFFSDALGRINTMIVCGILVAIANLGIVYFPGLSAIYLSMAIFGFGQGAIWPLYALCASDYFPERSTGFIVGLWTLFFGFGSILSPIVSGWIADLTGRFMGSFLLAIVTAIISLLLLIPIERWPPFTDRRSRDPRFH